MISLRKYMFTENLQGCYNSCFIKIIFFSVESTKKDNERTKRVLR